MPDPTTPTHHGGLATSARIVVTTIARTSSTLRNHRLGAFVPLFVVLLVGAVVLWVVNTIAPLAPFVYSLI